MGRLDRVEESSRNFNHSTFGDIRTRKRRLLRRLRGIQRVQERVDSARLSLLEQRLRDEYDNLLQQEEIFWFQKAREDYLKLGDRNNRYFHTQTLIRRQRNRVHGLNVDGRWESDPVKLAEHAQEHFRERYAAAPSSASVLYSTVPLPPMDYVADMGRPPDALEIKNTVFGMKSFAAPGLDGFQAIFYKLYWDIVGAHVGGFVSAAIREGKFDADIAKTLICLIPKVDIPTSISQFRPISLCNVAYKILTKLLVNRLRPHLADYIGPFQSAFLPGRSTSGSAIILQEVINSFRKRQRKSCDLVIKIDFEKAYDSVRWDFLEGALTEMKLPENIIQCIMCCVRSPSYSVLWNGSPSSPFAPTRGLRQGDPLSPYLFVIVMEKFSKLVQHEVSSGNWQPVQLSRDAPPLSHLIYADDLLLFSTATPENARCIADTLSTFARSSGLKFNTGK